MAARLNHLFQNSPQAFLRHTVLFTDGFSCGDAAGLMRHRSTHLIDFEQLGPHARARVLPSLHLYQDAPLVSYFVPSGGTVAVPRENPPYPFVFLPEFTRGRLLVYRDGPEWLRLQVEENLNGRMPRPQDPVIESFAYWDHAGGDLVGVVRASAVLVKQPEQPWTVLMQQIVGPSGHELVRQVFTKQLAV